MSIPVVAHAEHGHPLLIKEIDAALSRAGITEQKGERETVSGETLSHPDAWRYNPDAGCRYVQAMVAGWANDAPSERNPWMYNKMHKIAAACRLGCIDEATRDSAKEALGKRMRELLLREPKRELKKLELEGAWLRAVDKIARKTDDQVRAELARKGELHIHLSDSCPNGQPPPGGQPKTSAQRKTSGQRITRKKAHSTFRKWLGKGYDTDALDAILAAIAVEKFDDGSDLIWLLLISGSGNAKTEAVQAAAGAGAIITSSISSDAALLSATPKKEHTKGASGGLLLRVGARGVLAIKDVTSILSMNRDLRAKVLAALREVYDGRWCRDVGTDGGRRIEWEGRIAVIGAVTTAWDTAHSVISAMGDRFVLIRIDSTQGRTAAGRKAIGNTGAEPQMRAELAGAVAGVIAGMNTTPITLTKTEVETLLAAADLVTLARTAVEVDYRGDVIDAHAPEMPTRFAKQLTQIVRGGVAVGMTRPDALRLAIRCARDSMPPMRLAIIEDLAAHGRSTASDVCHRIDKPRSTVERQLQALHTLGVFAADEEYYTEDKSRWRYTLRPHIDIKVIRAT
ncbi:MAG: hypothetical protein ACLP9Y_19030 [Mycobacterium sp.]